MNSKPQTGKFAAQRWFAPLIVLITFLVLPLLFNAWQASGQGRETNTFAGSVQPFLAKNCYGCHNSSLKSGGLDLQSFKSAASVAEFRETWEKILKKVEAGEMPPPAMPRPDEVQLRAATSWIEGEFKRLDAHVKPDPGRVTARRLNRDEYNNTIRDLTGVDFQPANDFPQDDSGYGFDNNGDVLSLSPVLMEKYLAAAEKVARLAVFGHEQLKPTMVRHQPTLRRRLEKAGPPVTIPPQYTLTNYDFTGLGQPSALHFKHFFPADGEYSFRMTTYRNRPRGSDPVEMALWVDGKVAKTVQLDQIEPEGETREVRTTVPAGERWVAVSFLRQFDGLPASYGGLNPSTRPVPAAPARGGGGGGLQPPPNATPEELAQFQKRAAAAAGRSRQAEPADAIVLNWVEVVGPFEYAKGPSDESRRKIMICGHAPGAHNAACARKIMSNLARRAYRRPVTAPEVDRLVELVADTQKRGHSLEDGVSLALEALLVSPDFLFRVERDPDNLAPGASHPISQYELATRLSYFLWSSMPDDELLHLADQGALRGPAVLDAQVRRMLKDPKSKALVDNFGGQWLQFRNLESVKPDLDAFPDFEDYLRMSMQQETEMFFANIIHEDRSILDFIDGKYTFLNERLATLYHIPGVKGPEFRKVELSGDERSGVLTQASILTVSSYANRTSPVLRGKWILENILNTPPPPPPPNVPALEASASDATVSLRQMLEKHRANAVCASCHSRMDPLGFALENYDAIGAWRTQDGNVQIDSTGTLPSGKSFHGPQELKAILRSQSGQFTECMTEKLLTYAIGRGVEPYDQKTVKTIAGQVEANQYRFSALVLEIVKSLPFQMRRADRGKT